MMDLSMDENDLFVASFAKASLAAHAYAGELKLAQELSMGTRAVADTGDRRRRRRARDQRQTASATQKASICSIGVASKPAAAAAAAAASREAPRRAPPPHRAAAIGPGSTSVGRLRFQLAEALGVSCKAAEELGASLGTEVVDKKLRPLSRTFESKCAELAVAGDLLENMVRSVRNEAASAWEAYHAHASKPRMTAAASSAEAACDGAADPWLLELGFARASRATLLSRRAYSKGMANLFEQFRQLEASRTVELGQASEHLAGLMARVLGASATTAPRQATAAAASGAEGSTSGLPHLHQLQLAARGLNTHRDFAAAIDKVAWSTYQARLTHHAGKLSKPSVGKAEAAAAEEERPFLAAIGTDAPADVPSALRSPLVTRWGRLEQRGGGLLRRWRPCTAVLTVSGSLFLFGEGEDLATNQEVLKRAAPAAAPTASAGGAAAGAGVGGRASPAAPAGEERPFAPGKPFSGLGDLDDGDVLSLARGARKAPAVVMPLVSGSAEVSAQPRLGETAWEVTTRVPGMLFATTTKVTLRAGGRAAMTEWTEAIRQQAGVEPQ